jgi:FkbM family methyltransferase
MKRCILSAAWRLLALAGFFFLVSFASSARFRSATPGYRAVNDAYYMLRANLNRDLREQWLWYDWDRKTIDGPSFDAESAITAVEDGLLRWETPMGIFWMPQREPTQTLHDMAEVLLRGVCDYRGRTVRPGDVVVDCGAHLGSFTRYALRKGARLVVAVEPSSTNVSCLKRTFTDEIAAGRVMVARLAVWDRDGSMWLAGPTSMEKAVNGTAAGPGRGAGEWVTAKTIDHLMKEWNLPALDFLKMDIEGAEVAAIRGAHETLRRYRPFLAIATEHTEDKVRNVRNVIAAVRASGVDYRIGFGRYVRYDRNPYAPIETFFYR